jgi:hypothetical protein
MVEKARLKGENKKFKGPEIMEFLRGNLLARRLFKSPNKALINAIQNFDGSKAKLRIIIDNAIDPAITSDELRQQFLTIVETAWTA